MTYIESLFIIETYSIMESLYLPLHRLRQKYPALTAITARGKPDKNPCVIPV